jgi:hypothetical protein
MRTLGMDVPIALGIASRSPRARGRRSPAAVLWYFDSVTMFVFLLLGARYLEVVALGRAGRSLLGLARIVPGRGAPVCAVTKAWRPTRCSPRRCRRRAIACWCARRNDSGRRTLESDVATVNQALDERREPARHAPQGRRGCCAAPAMQAAR